MADQPQGQGWWRATDGRWYPPETHPAARSQASAPPAGGPNRTVLWVVLAGLVAVAIGVGAVLVTRSNDDAAEPGGSTTESVLLEPLATEGPDSFTSSTTIIDLGDEPPATLDTVPEGDPSPTGGVRLVGTEPGLYGGSRDDAICDTEALVTFLTDPANAAKAEAWAGVRGIAVADIPDHIAGLTPSVLRVDTLVTNHGFNASGQATARQSVLQAGTAVLLDATGTPAARCACGNPLLAPTVAGAYDTTGPAWDGFSVDRTVTVQPGTAVDTFTLTDIATGETFEQPAGAAAGSIVLVADGNPLGAGEVGPDTGLALTDDAGAITDRIPLTTPADEVIAALTPILGPPVLDSAETIPFGLEGEENGDVCSFRDVAWPGLFLFFAGYGETAGLFQVQVYAAGSTGMNTREGLPQPEGDPPWRTDRGIGVGSTLAEVSAAYPGLSTADPSYIISNDLYLEAGSDGLVDSVTVWPGWYFECY